MVSSLTLWKLWHILAHQNLWVLKIVWQTNHPSKWRGVEGDIYNLLFLWGRIPPSFWADEQKLRENMHLINSQFISIKSISRKYKSVRFMNFHCFSMETVGRRSKDCRRKSLVWLVPWTGNAMWCTQICMVLSVADRPFAFTWVGGGKLCTTIWRHN